MYQFQDPQEDNIRDAKDLILVPDNMEFYREQKPQEQEKAKREQAIADAVTRRKQDEWEAKKQELSGAASACCVGLFSCVGLLVRNSQYVYVYIHICIYVYVYVLYVCMYVCIYVYKCI